jgi:DNA-binding NtrC family response regulator
LASREIGMKRTTVILVEDDPLSRMVALDACERAGFDVADFSSAAEAMAFAERMPESIAAFVTDIRVPGNLDGVDLALSVGHRWPDIPVLVTSGRYEPPGPDDLPSATSFLPKPWTAKILMARLQTMVSPGFDQTASLQAAALRSTGSSTRNGMAEGM